MNILKILTPKRVTGNFGENAATDFLKKNGYSIKERNYISPPGEIDIIAEKDDTLAFIEVKTRTLGKESLKETRPAAAVTREKQRKIISSAKFYVGTNKTGKRLRLDIIEVYLIKNGKDLKVQNIKHIENAFRR